MIDTEYLERCSHVPEWLVTKYVEIIHHQAGANFKETAWQEGWQALVMSQAQLRLSPALERFLPEEFAHALRVFNDVFQFKPLELVALTVFSSVSFGFEMCSNEQPSKDYVSLKWECLGKVLGGRCDAERCS